MTSISAVTYRSIAKKLRSLGFVFDRQAKGSHEIWRNPKTNRYVTVPNHPGAVPVATVRAIIRQTGLTPDEFLNNLD